MEERQLIQRAQGGDRAAVEELLGRYEEQVYRVVARFFPNPGDACDVAQDAMLRIYDRLGGFAWRSSFSTWVYRVTTNMCLDALRRRKTRDEALSENLASREEGPEENVVRQETRNQVRRAMSGLCPEHRAILVLREVEEMDYGEIAVVLGLTEGTVKSRLFRAREAFKRRYLMVTRGGESREVQSGKRALLRVAGR